MANTLLYLKSHFLASDSIYGALNGIIWSIILASVLLSIRKWYGSKKSLPLVPGLKTPPFSIFGSLYTFPSSKVLKKFSLPISAFVIQTVSGHSKIFEKEKLFYLDLGPRRMIILRSPDVVEEVLKSTTLISKAWVYDFLLPWLGTGLLTSTGPKWKSRRKLLTPSFHFDILKDFLPIMNEQSRILVDVLKEDGDKECVNVVQPATLCALDIICASTLGVDMGAQRNCDSDYVRAVLRTSETVMDRMCTPHLWPEILFHMSARGRQFRKDVQTLHSFTTKVIRQKQDAFKQQSEEKEGTDNSYSEPRKRRKALMDLLIEHQMKHHDLTEEDIREEVDTFAFEGHDTTSMGLSWALYLVGLYPDVQAKLHDEMDAVYGDDTERDVTADDIRDMPYLDCVLKESQRLYPSVPMFARKIEKDQEFCFRLVMNEHVCALMIMVYVYGLGVQKTYTHGKKIRTPGKNSCRRMKWRQYMCIGGYTVRKGDIFSLCPVLLHRQADAFPNPEKFDPDRFLPENSTGRHPFAYIPFSAGPRNCIGQRFALMEEKVVIANVLRNFQIKSLDERDKIIEVADLILRPAGPLRLKFTPRTSPLSNSY